MTQISDRLVAARKATGRTQQQVAFRSGLSLATVQRIEAGRNEPTIQTLRALAEATDADLADLLGNLQPSTGDTAA